MKRSYLLRFGILIIYVFWLYSPFIFNNKLPIPADTIVGMYHPFRDYYRDQYPNGIPFKNLLVTDAVRQLYPWRQLAIEQLKIGRLPLWNPYSFSGYPLMANFQSAPFYPLNFLYWFLDFPLVWSIQVLSQSLLGGMFMIFYLKHLKLRDESIVLGSLAWAGSGFFIGWLTSNTLVHTVVWLPLLLLSIDYIADKNSQFKGLFIFIVSLLGSYLAGHLQTAFYVSLVVFAYTVFKIFQSRKIRTGVIVAAGLVIVLLVSSFWWLRGVEFLLQSARDLDQTNWQRPDWFIPYQHLIQFLAPDFFGNPATLNYFGVWNYGEFVGFIGVLPLIFAVFAGIFNRKNTAFYIFILALSLLFALSNPIAKIPFILNVPFLSSAQPSRLIMLICFSLSVLSAFGLDWFLKQKIKRAKITAVLLIFGLVYFILWVYAFKLNLDVSKRNLYFPTAVFLAGGILIIFAGRMISNTRKNYIVFAIIIIVLFDLGRFGVKFMPFSPKNFLFPTTKSLQFLQNKTEGDVFRIASLDERIMADNYFINYKLQAITGYDPLYLKRYGEFMVALERGKPDINPPFGFNRAIRPKNYQSRLFDLLGVKYLLSLYQISNPQYDLVFEEGETKVYENQKAFPRAFFVEKVYKAGSKEEAIDKMFGQTVNLKKEAIVENFSSDLTEFSSSVSIKMLRYVDNKVIFETQSDKDGFLVITDIYYPDWKVSLDDKNTVIYITDYTFRGVLVPKGEHKIVFYL